MPVERGYTSPTLNVIGEQDLLGERLYNPRKKKVKTENLITESSALNAGESVVHTEHGIGRFEELVTLSIAGVSHDC